jgi:uncharacterized membrane protein
MKNEQNKTKRLAGLAVFGAVIIFLQLFATFVKFGPIEITLALIPIVVGAAAYGTLTGTFLGLIFGGVTLVACIFGWAPGGNILWTANPLVTALLCFVKAGAAGFVSGFLYNLFSKKNSGFAAVAAAVACPIVNTGIFCLGMALFYGDTLNAWAGDTPVLTYMLFGLVGVNFVIEFSVNVILSPVAARILRIKNFI